MSYEQAVISDGPIRAFRVPLLLHKLRRNWKTSCSIDLMRAMIDMYRREVGKVSLGRERSSSGKKYLHLSSLGKHFFFWGVLNIRKLNRLITFPASTITILVPLGRTMKTNTIMSVRFIKLLFITKILALWYEYYIGIIYWDLNSTIRGPRGNGHEINKQWSTDVSTWKLGHVVGRDLSLLNCAIKIKCPDRLAKYTIGIADVLYVPAMAT